MLCLLCNQPFRAGDQRVIFSLGYSNPFSLPVYQNLLVFRKVLVTEWIEGEKLAASSKETINRLIPVGIECFLTQLLETGFFHADPHPGNLLVSSF